MFALIFVCKMNFGTCPVLVSMLLKISMFTSGMEVNNALTSSPPPSPLTELKAISVVQGQVILFAGQFHVPDPNTPTLYRLKKNYLDGFNTNLPLASSAFPLSKVFPGLLQTQIYHFNCQNCRINHTLILNDKVNRKRIIYVDYHQIGQEFNFYALSFDWDAKSVLDYSGLTNNRNETWISSFEPNIFYSVNKHDGSIVKYYLAPSYARPDQTQILFDYRTRIVVVAPLWFCTNQTEHMQSSAGVGSQLEGILFFSDHKCDHPLHWHIETGFVDHKWFYLFGAGKVYIFPRQLYENRGPGMQSLYRQVDVHHFFNSSAIPVTEYSSESYTAQSFWLAIDVGIAFVVVIALLLMLPFCYCLCKSKKPVKHIDLVKQNDQLPVQENKHKESDKRKECFAKNDTPQAKEAINPAVFGVTGDKTNSKFKTNLLKMIKTAAENNVKSKSFRCKELGEKNKSSKRNSKKTKTKPPKVQPKTSSKKAPKEKLVNLKKVTTKVDGWNPNSGKKQSGKSKKTKSKELLLSLKNGKVSAKKKINAIDFSKSDKRRNLVGVGNVAISSKKDNKTTSKSKKVPMATGGKGQSYKSKGIGNYNKSNKK